MLRLLADREALSKKIERAARAVVPVLLDAGRTNSAKELQELFFELDALDQGAAAFMRDNLEQIAASAIEAIAARWGTEPA